MARRTGQMNVIFKGEDKLSAVAQKVTLALGEVARAGQLSRAALGSLGIGVAAAFPERSVRRARQFSTATGQVRSKVGEASRAVARMNSIMGAAGRRVGFATKAMAGFFAVFTGIRALRATTTLLAEFDDTMAQVGAISRATAREFEYLTKTARALGATTKFTAKESAEGLLYLARTGFSVQQSIAAVRATLDLATIGFMDLGEAADYASNIVQQFALRAEDTRRVVDAMVVVSNNANTNIQQLAQALKFAGPLAGALGQEVEATSAAIGVLGDRGLQATLAGRGLRGVMASLLKPTDEARTVLTQMGIALDKINPEAHNLVSIFKTLRGANLSASQALRIFNRESVNQALILIRNVESMEDLIDLQKELAGESKRISDVMQSTLGGQFKQLRSAMEEFGQSLGEAGLTKFLKDSTQVLTEAIRILAGFEGAAQEASEGGLRLAHVIKVVTAGLAAFVAMHIGAFLINLGRMLVVTGISFLRLGNNIRLATAALFRYNRISTGAAVATRILARSVRASGISFTSIASLVATAVIVFASFSSKASLVDEAMRKLPNRFHEFALAAEEAIKIKVRFDKAMVSGDQEKALRRLTELQHNANERAIEIEARIRKLGEAKVQIPIEEIEQVIPVIPEIRFFPHHRAAAIRELEPVLQEIAKKLRLEIEIAPGIVDTRALLMLIRQFDDLREAIREAEKRGQDFDLTSLITKFDRVTSIIGEYIVNLKDKTRIKLIDLLAPLLMEIYAAQVELEKVTRLYGARGVQVPAEEAAALRRRIQDATKKATEELQKFAKNADALSGKAAKKFIDDFNKAVIGRFRELGKEAPKGKPPVYDPVEMDKATIALERLIKATQFETQLIGESASKKRILTALREAEAHALKIEETERKKLIARYREALELQERELANWERQEGERKASKTIGDIIQQLDRRIALMKVDASIAETMRQVWDANDKVNTKNIFTFLKFNAVLMARLLILRALERKEEERRKKQAEEERREERRKAGGEDIKRRIRDLEFEVSLIGKGTIERVRAIAQQELLNIAMETGAEVSQRMLDHVAALAETLERAAQGSQNLAQDFKEALAEGGVSQATNVVFDNLKRQIRGTEEEVTVFSAALGDAFEDAARAGMDAFTDALLDPLVKEFQRVFGDNGVLTKILSAFFDTFLRMMMQGLVSQLFAGLGIPGLGGAKPGPFSVSLAPSTNYDIVGGGGGGTSQFTGGGGDFGTAAPEGAAPLGIPDKQGKQPPLTPIIPFVLPPPTAPRPKPVPIPRRKPFPAPPLPKPPEGGAPLGGGAAGPPVPPRPPRRPFAPSPMGILRPIFARLSQAFPKARRGQQFPTFGAFAQALQAGKVVSAPRPLATGLPGGLDRYLAAPEPAPGGGGDYGSAAAPPMPEAITPSRTRGEGAAPIPGRSPFGIRGQAPGLSNIDFSYLGAQIGQVLPPKGAQVATSLAGLGGAVSSGLAGILGPSSALAGVLGPIGAALSLATIGATLGIESYTQGKQLDEIIKSGSLKDVDKAFGRMERRSMYTLWNPFLWSAANLPGLFTSKAFKPGEKISAAGLGMLAAAPLSILAFGPLGIIAAIAGIGHIFSRARKRARRRLKRELRRLTNLLRDQVKAALPDTVTPDYLAKLDRIFTADYLSRDELNRIASEGLDPYRDLELNILQRNPAFQAYRRASGAPYLAPGGSAPLGIPAINQPPMAEDSVTRLVNPDGLESGLKAIQRYLVPLIEDVRVSEGIRESMDLSVPLAQLIPHRFTKQALSRHPEVFPEVETHEGAKDSPWMFRPLTDGLLTKLTKAIRPTQTLGDVTFSRGAEQALLSAREIYLGQMQRLGSRGQTVVQVGAPQLSVNAKLSGGYSVEMLARDLSFHTAKSIGASLGTLSNV